MFLMLLGQFYKDTFVELKDVPDWYAYALQKEKERSTNIQRVKLLEITQKELNLCNRTNDLNLLLDQAIYEMEEIKYGRSH